MSISMAAQARDLLLSDRHRMVSLLESTEHGRIAIEEFSTLKPTTAEFTNIGRLDASGTARKLLEQGLREIMEALTPALADIAGVKEIHLVAVDSEQASARTRGFADGSHLVLVSDAMSSLLGHLGELLAVWGLSKGRNRYVSAFRRARDLTRRESPAVADPVVMGGAATLRYYIQHQRVWALAAKVGTTMPRLKVLRNIDAGISAVALMFIVAHEVAHAVLGHSADPAGADKDRQHQREHEADQFAFKVLARALDSSDLAAEAAIVGLCAIAISTEPLFVRTPESHPDIDRRISNITQWASTSAQSHVVHFWGLLEMVIRAVDTKTALPRDYWQHMHDRPEFDTRHHSRGYFNHIQNFDFSIDLTPSRLWTEIQALRDSAFAEKMTDYEQFRFGDIGRGLAHLVDHRDPVAALNSWGVAGPEKVADPQRPLSYHALISAIIDADALTHALDRLPVRLVAVYLANATAPYLSRTENSDVGR